MVTMVKRPTYLRIRVTYREKKRIERIAHFFSMDVAEFVRTAIRISGTCVVCHLKVWFIQDHMYYAGNWVHSECLGAVTVPMHAPEHQHQATGEYEEVHTE